MAVRLISKNPQESYSAFVGCASGITTHMGTWRGQVESSSVFVQDLSIGFASGRFKQRKQKSYAARRDNGNAHGGLNVT